ncbi:hypothetical protein BpHYR1_009529 [Brachionus plicatilis]|uniref:Uncharacterized protein n=1 Tax=Brachionus plicatilis TaxID=10195 RepID=A0A3M7STN3_BRAPC|nr:hypothetical protein BpHYR1_009529 [Brachionus plicatilis]
MSHLQLLLRKSKTRDNGIEKKIWIIFVDDLKKTLLQSLIKILFKKFLLKLNATDLKSFNLGDLKQKNILATYSTVLSQVYLAQRFYELFKVTYLCIIKFKYSVLPWANFCFEEREREIFRVYYDKLSRFWRKETFV